MITPGPARLSGAPAEVTTVERALRLLETMAVIRAFEERAGEEAARGRVPGVVHQSVGQEAVATGVAANLRREDYLFSNHRGHGHAIAKGADPAAMMLELFGREGGTCGGKGGSMHIADFSVGMLGANGILADGATMAVGAAQAIRLLGEDRISCVFIGDGTVNRGPFLESLNWAAVFELPVLYVIEDNIYASSTLTASVLAGPGIAARSAAFGIPATVVDGNDAISVDRVARELIEEVRNGRNGTGPRLLHATTYRVTGHISRDALYYRPAGELERFLPLDPIARLCAWLRARGVDAEQCEDVLARARASIARAAEEASVAPYPAAGRAYEDVQDIGGPRPCA